MKRPANFCFLPRLLAASLAAGAGACQQPAEEEKIPQVPQLEALPAAYRPIDRTDTLASYWAPDSLLTDSTFAFTAAHRSLLLVRAQFLPASEMKRQRRDALAFRPKSSQFFLDTTGYAWYFGYQVDEAVELAKNKQGLPTQVFKPLTNRLSLVESRRHRENGALYERHSYLMDYPFLPMGLTKVSDSVVYVRAYPIRRNVRQPDAYYTYRYNERGAADSVLVPHYADQIDSSRVANIRFSFRPLPEPHRSADR